MTWMRALLAVGLSVLLPGAGHALLRDWVRALLFAGLYIATAAIFLPTDQVSAATSMSEAISVATTEIELVDQLIISFIVVFAAVDAGFRALGYPPGSNDGAGSDAPSCPQCGRELDEELEFCHWCTTRLDAHSEAEEA